MKLKKGLLYVFIANLINLLISLFSGFVLPKMLSIETYADIKLFQLYVSYIGFVSLGFADGMYLKYGGKNIEELDAKVIREEFNTYKVFQIIISIIGIVISIIVKNSILLFCMLTVFPVNVAGYVKNLYQAIGKFKEYSRYTNINTFLVFIINIILLFIIKTDNPKFYIGTYVIAYFLYWLIVEYENNKVFKKIENCKCKKIYLVENVKQGFFLMLGNFCNVMFTSIDRQFVQKLLGNIKFAYYSFAVSIENLMDVFISPISTVMYNYLCCNNEVKSVLKIKRLVLVFATIIVAVIFPAKFVIDVWITKYLEAETVLFILFAAQFVNIIIRCIHLNLYKSEKKQNRYFAIMVIVIALSVVLNIILYQIDKNMEMIAIATLITNIIWFAIGEIDLKKYKFRTKEYICIAITIILLLICGKYLNAILGCIVYLTLSVVSLCTFMPETIKEIKSYVTKIIILRGKEKNEKM